MSEQTTQEFYLKLSKLFDKDESKFPIKTKYILIQINYNIKFF